MRLEQENDAWARDRTESRSSWVWQETWFDPSFVRGMASTTYYHTECCRLMIVFIGVNASTSRGQSIRSTFRLTPTSVRKLPTNLRFLSIVLLKGIVVGLVQYSKVDGTIVDQPRSNLRGCCHTTAQSQDHRVSKPLLLLARSLAFLEL